MSIENAKTFLGRVEKDPAALRRLGTLREGAEVAAMAAEMGLPCSAEEIKNVLREARQAAGSLSDRELDAVAGGTLGAYAGVIRQVYNVPGITGFGGLGCAGGTYYSGMTYG